MECGERIPLPTELQYHRIPSPLTEAHSQRKWSVVGSNYCLSGHEYDAKYRNLNDCRGGSKIRELQMNPWHANGAFIDPIQPNAFCRLMKPFATNPLTAFTEFEKASTGK